MNRYSDKLINTLVRNALTLEKKKRFDEAIEIYEELAIQGVEFAIDRIPIAKHRADNYKLRKINYCSELIAAIAIGLAIILVSYNTAINTLQPIIGVKYSFALNQTNSISEKDSQKVNIHFNLIEDNVDIDSSEYTIVVDKNITRRNLSKRVNEALEAYKDNAVLNKLFTININIIKDGTQVSAGYIEYDLNNPQECKVFTKKSVL